MRPKFVCDVIFSCNFLIYTLYNLLHFFSVKKRIATCDVVAPPRRARVQLKAEEDALVEVFERTAEEIKRCRRFGDAQRQLLRKQEVIVVEADKATEEALEPMRQAKRHIAEIREERQAREACKLQCVIICTLFSSDYKLI